MAKKNTSKTQNEKIRKLENALKAMTEPEEGDDSKVLKLKKALKSMTSI